MLKEDCRFYDKKKKKCNALKELYCAKESKECKFHRTKGKEEKE